ncbi:MAG: type II toxin-antitoxin system Phd/YefM family antitoxin [Candidatus Competibacteraceae bacterium]|jgi:prevent-host-death family protein|nr:type II toxin-antitoxin system Phd/YefM family antitoxin [Candidatus Competibacteraceae bacterium]
MHTWQLQEAKSRFSELVDRTLAEGPQLVTRRGAEAVVVIAAPEFRRLCSGLSLREVLRNAPRGEPLDLERSAEPVREIEW